MVLFCFWLLFAFVFIHCLFSNRNRVRKLCINGLSLYLNILDLVTVEAGHPILIWDIYAHLDTLLAHIQPLPEVRTRRAGELKEGPVLHLWPGRLGVPPVTLQKYPPLVPGHLPVVQSCMPTCVGHHPLGSQNRSHPYSVEPIVTCHRPQGWCHRATWDRVRVTCPQP